MLLNEIMEMLCFANKIEHLTEEELGIYEEKNKIRIDYPLFAETFLEKVAIIKVAKKGEEKLSYYIYCESYWVLLDTDLLKGLIRKCLNKYINQMGVYIEDKLVKEVLNLAIRIEKVDMMNYKLNFKDGVYNFRSLKYEETSKENYFINAKDYKVNEMDLETPVFDKFMSDIMCGDNDSIEYLLQFMGCCLSGMQKLEKFTLFMGHGSNGKSTLIKLLSKIIGDNYVETRDISSLNETFSMEGLDKTKLIISTESSFKKEVSVEMLKKLTTPGEKIYMNRKNLKAETVELNLNLIFACNQPIDFGKIDTKDESIKRRLILIFFNKKFEEHEKDRELDDKLKFEISGITLKLIQAYERLVKNKYILPKSELIEEATEDYVSKYIYKKPPNWKIKNFIDMYLEKDENCLMSISYMHQKYQEQTRDNSIKEQTFAKEIRLAMPEKDKRDPSKTGKEVLELDGVESSRYFVGFKLREKPLPRRPLCFSSKIEQIV
ncbi:MAG: hypothetical protein KA384_08460 [Leptotrichiaceae bacterium]|nr:hypothetical protein [Leptotrichiaceae bacterium]MBP6714504.1 hypothetical protein [Aliarcobacter sp.]